jgi:hypothetical protein
MLVSVTALFISIIIAFLTGYGGLKLYKSITTKDEMEEGLLGHEY